MIPFKAETMAEVMGYHREFRCGGLHCGGSPVRSADSAQETPALTQPKSHYVSKQKTNLSTPPLQDLGPQTEAMKAGKTNWSATQAGHFEGSQTVIVGAGIIGLALAAELAKKAWYSGKDHRVTIIDIRRKHCELASNHSAGLITRVGLEETDSWEPLMRRSFETWREMLNSEALKQELAYNGEGNLVVTPANTRTGLDLLPQWFPVDPNERVRVREDDNCMGQV